MPRYRKDHPLYKPYPHSRRQSKWERAEFIAWDGEGETDPDGTHRYVMLCCSTGEHIVNPEGLSTEECFAFLCKVGSEHPHAIHVCFGASYDINMMLRDWTQSEVRKLWDHKNLSGLIKWREYECSYRPRKEFCLHKLSFHPNGKPVWEKRGEKWRRKREGGLTLWDVFAFFQTSFVGKLDADGKRISDGALEKYLGDAYPLLDQIRQGKARRSQFSESERAETLAYCQAELTALVDLMQRLHADLETAGLQLRRWDGAGAVAAALLTREGVKNHMEEAPEVVRLAAQSAFSGGRIELGQYGYHRGALYHYDINSAYPAAMCELPSLAGGTWQREADGAHPLFSLHYVRWTFDDCSPLMPFFYRLPDGRILYPSEGEGWHWKPELDAADMALASHAIEGHYTILESWHFVPANDVRPFAFIPLLYEQRRQWKRDGVGAEKVLKLGLNSLYGKQVQQVGARKGQKPTFHQLEWGGFVTAYTRAKLYEAAIQAPEHIVMEATDGLYSTLPLSVPEGTGLGEWESEVIEGLLVAQSGVYWKFPDPERHFFCRGFDKGSLSWEAILSCYEHHQESYQAELTRFITMGSALASDLQWKNWRTWRTIPKELSLLMEGTKRRDIQIGRAHPWKRYPPHCRLVPTFPAFNYAVGLASALFPVVWEQPSLGQIDAVEARIVESEAEESNV